MMNGTLRAPRRASAKNRAALKPAIPHIVCISDTHGLHRKIAVPEGDLLLKSLHRSRVAQIGLCYLGYRKGSILPGAVSQ